MSLLRWADEVATLKGLLAFWRGNLEETVRRQRAAFRGRRPVVDVLVTEGELAAQFGVSDRTVRRWRADGMPSFKRENGARRYSPAACRAWLAAQGD